MKSIILYPHEIRRLLEADEAQIWRPIKPQPDHFHRDIFDGRNNWDRLIPQVGGREIVCPFQPGERRWVKETWVPFIRGNDEDGYDCLIRFAADGMEIRIPQFREWWNQCLAKTCYYWRSPVTMPRWASRLTVEIVSVRVQRVQETSEEDARAGGIEGPGPGVVLPGPFDQGRGMQPGFSVLGVGTFPTAKDAFRFLWDYYYAKRGFGWDKNPWVWNIGSKRTDRAEG